jgi:hypothetical protein
MDSGTSCSGGGPAVLLVVSNFAVRCRIYGKAAFLAPITAEAQRSDWLIDAELCHQMLLVVEPDLAVGHAEQHCLQRMYTCSERKRFEKMHKAGEARWVARRRRKQGSGTMHTLAVRVLERESSSMHVIDSGR